MADTTAHLGGLGEGTDIFVFVADSLTKHPQPLRLGELRPGAHRVLVSLDPLGTATAFARVSRVLRSSGRVPLYGAAGFASNQLWAPAFSESATLADVADAIVDEPRTARGACGEWHIVDPARLASARSDHALLVCVEGGQGADLQKKRGGGFAAMLVLCPSARSGATLRWVLLPPAS